MTPPAGFKVAEGKYFNPYFPGWNIGMPPPLVDGSVTYSDGTKATVAQEAHDVATFLMWAAEPKMEQRKRLGFEVLIFLTVLSGLLYLSYRRVWKDAALTASRAEHRNGREPSVPALFLCRDGRALSPWPAMLKGPGNRTSAGPMTKTVLGIIGGSGVYDIAGLENARWERVASPWGEASDELHFGTLDGVDMVFLPRHGRGHIQSPTTINYRANIDALKRAGVTDIISLSACGSFKEELPPGTFVMADQFIDRTHNREKTFFGDGFVAHVSLAHPVCPKLQTALVEACDEEGLPHVKGGTYLAMEGPQFSTLAESKLYKSWGCSVIGMTAMPEAKLAREAEIPYAIVAMVTDFDCWHPDHDHVTVDTVVQGADRQCRQGAHPGQARGAQAGPGAHARRRSASKPRSTPPSSPRPKSATPNSSPSSMRWRAACSKETDDGFQSRHPHHSGLSQEGDHVPRHHHAARQSARLPQRRR